ncbi:MAG: chemotaxis protein CheX, partial [Candidatus Saccharibacteria bacterium]
DEMLVARGKIVGVKAFLQKPFKQYQLLLAIRQACGAAGEKKQNSFVEQFIQALRDNLKEVANLDCKIEVYTDQEAKMISQGMAVMVGLTGNQQGRLILDLVPDTASKLASRMFGKDILSEDNVINGLAELTNIIGGHSVSRINNIYRETEIRLTPPSVLMGKNMCLVNPRLNMTKVVAITEIGSLVMGIGFSGGVQ